MAYAPAQHMMQGNAYNLEAYLGNKKGILVKQTPRGCLRECMGCEAKSEYKISAMDFGYLQSGGVLTDGATSQRDEMYALEQSSFCMRCCWRDGRSMSIGVSAGGEAGGTPIIDYTKPCGCPLNMWIPTGEDGGVEVPCCCFLPELKATVDGHELKSKYICDGYCCVSKFAYLEDGREIYRLKPDTCCFGCCPTCRFGFRRRPAIPFFFYDANDNRITDGQNDDDKQPQIRKVFTGLAKECCTTADTFAVFFPQEADVKRKAGLLGLTFLLDFTVFERQGQDVA
eukprot:TRINITY_DN55336_c0_g1_i1.p1 TRINITY_DN55336_c0_g1~~TRINITY_DN55336_c0_g1_i1.p1  ORF type:complete len:284 (-),score=47.05 TRINITY_DN55336_c0_g1_i1:116-967(-)